MLSEHKLLKRPINEAIQLKKSRLKLLESDRKAYSQNVNDALQDCKKRVQELRKGNVRLRKQLFEKLRCDEHIINQAFQRNPTEKSMFANKTSYAALEIMNGKVCDKAKQLNMMKYISVMKNIHLETLNDQYDNLNFEILYVNETSTGVNKDGQEMRGLENRLDKATLKCSEAQQINKIYIQIKYKLQEEYLHYGNNLDALENEIIYCNKDLCHIRVLYKDSIIAHDFAIRELKDKEDQVFVDRKRREKELQYMKRAVEDKQSVNENVERRLETRDSNVLSNDSLLNDIQINDGYELKIEEYEQTYRAFQEISGVLDLQEAVARYQNQNNTEIHLRNIIDEYEKHCINYRKEKERFLHKLYCGKYESETIFSFNEENHLNVEDYIKIKEQHNTELKRLLNHSSSILALCKLSAEHIDEILPVTYWNTLDTRKICNKNDVIVDLFDKIQFKIISLVEQMKEYDKREFRKKIHSPPILETFNEFENNVLKAIPMHNTRVSIRKSMKDIYIDEDDPDSGDDDNMVPTRVMLKRQAYSFVDAKIKKKNPKKKKKTKEK